MRRALEPEVYDCSGAGVALPLAIRRAAGKEAGDTLASDVVRCSTCGVRYFARPTGSHLPEDGRCRSCASGKTAATAPVVPLRRRGSR